MSGGDPVQLGLVASLSRPGGNVTGVTFLVATLAAKLLGLLRDLLPQAARIAVLTDPNMPVTESFVSDALAAGDIDAVFAQLAQAVDVLLVGPAVLFTTRRAQLVTLAAYHRVPAIYSFREAAEAGGLMSHQPALLSLGFLPLSGAQPPAQPAWPGEIGLAAQWA
jgi:putative ABC transport system substrate-binding protein